MIVFNFSYTFFIIFEDFDHFFDDMEHFLIALYYIRLFRNRKLYKY